MLTPAADAAPTVAVHADAPLTRQETRDLLQLERDFLDADGALANALRRLARLGRIPAGAAEVLRSCRRSLWSAYEKSRPLLLVAHAAQRAADDDLPF